MADAELVKKMLWTILQANKGGVSLSRLQSEYKELTGEHIPHKQMGHNQLDALLASMPSVVCMERNRSGEVCVSVMLWLYIYIHRATVKACKECYIILISLCKFVSNLHSI